MPTPLSTNAWACPSFRRKPEFGSGAFYLDSGFRRNDGWKNKPERFNLSRVQMAAGRCRSAAAKG